MVDEELHLDHHAVSDRYPIASSLELTVEPYTYPNEAVDHARLHQQRHDLEDLRAAPSRAEMLAEELPVLPAARTYNCTHRQRLECSHRAGGRGITHHVLYPINAVEKTFVASDSAMAAVPNASPLYTIGMLPGWPPCTNTDLRVDTIPSPTS